MKRTVGKLAISLGTGLENAGAELKRIGHRWEWEGDRPDIVKPAPVKQDAIVPFVKARVSAYEKDLLAYELYCQGNARRMSRDDMTAIFTRYDKVIGLPYLSFSDPPSGTSLRAIDNALVQIMKDQGEYKGFDPTAPRVVREAERCIEAHAKDEAGRILDEKRW